MRQKNRKIMAAGMAAVTLCTSLVSTPVYAAEASVSVDESMYVNLDYYGSVRSEQSPVTATAMMQEYLTGSGGFVDWLYDEFSAVLNLGDGYTAKALEYAREETKKLINGPDTEEYPSMSISVSPVLDIWTAGNQWPHISPHTLHRLFFR